MYHKCCDGLLCVLKYQMKNDEILFVLHHMSQIELSQIKDSIKNNDEVLFVIHRMYDYVLVRSTIYDTSTICKIQENANMAKTMFVAQIEISQILRLIFKIERTICDTQLLFAKHRHTNSKKILFYKKYD